LTTYLTYAKFTCMEDENKLKPYSFPMPDRLRAALQALADGEQRPLANYIRLVLERHVAEVNAPKPELETANT
jgi:hypothetical protein